MTLNAFEGAQDTARYEHIKTLVGRHKVDVLCLQEANGWHHENEARLKDFAGSTGLSHYVFGDSNTDSKLVMFSRRKIAKKKVHTEGFHHCVVQTWIETNTGLQEVSNFHANPFNEDDRLHEIRRLMTKIGKDAILCGDFNSLSRMDNYPETLLDTLTALGNERYGSGRLRFDVTDFLALQGFIDAAAMHGAHQCTFPAMTGMEAFQHPTRFDYVFVPLEVADAIKHIEVIRDPETRHMSDHFPMLIHVLEEALPAWTEQSPTPALIPQLAV